MYIYLLSMIWSPRNKSEHKYHAKQGQYKNSSIECFNYFDAKLSSMAQFLATVL